MFTEGFQWLPVVTGHYLWPMVASANKRTHARIYSLDCHNKDGNNYKCSQPSDKNISMCLRLVSLSACLSHVFFACAIIAMTSVGEKRAAFSAIEGFSIGYLVPWVGNLILIVAQSWHTF